MKKRMLPFYLSIYFTKNILLSYCNSSWRATLFVSSLLLSFVRLNKAIFTVWLLRDYICTVLYKPRKKYIKMDLYTLGGP